MRGEFCFFGYSTIFLLMFLNVCMGHVFMYSWYAHKLEEKVISLPLAVNSTHKHVKVNLVNSFY